MLAEGHPSQHVYDARATIVLHGALAKKYGRRHQLGVKTASEAAYALCAMVPGFRQDFQDGYYRVVRGPVATGSTVTEGMLNMRIGAAGEIHFLPRARGSKSGGTGKAILGAVILVAAVVASAGALAPVAGVAVGSTVTAGLGATAAIGGISLGVSWGTIAFFGASMLLSGISAILSPQNSSNQNSTDAKQSFGLTGSMNSVQQGTVIPVVYGRTRVGSVVASFGYSAEDYDPATVNAAAVGTYGGYGQSPLPGLGVGSGGGGKGGSSGGASEAPNTLRSRAVVRIMDILSEGPIGGLVNGAKSIYFNNTPLMAADGTFNFQGVAYEVRTGYPDQDPVDGYPAAEQTTPVNIQVKVGGAGPITQTITSSTATAVRVTTRLPALVNQNTTNGNLEATNVSYKIEIAPQGGTYTTVVTENVIGQKCTSPYQKSFRIPLPNVGTATSWSIRMTRLTPDSTVSSLQNDTYFDAVTLLTDQQLTYRNTAAIFLTIDAAAFGSQIPTRAYEIDGVLCQVPLNYDPIAGTYATSGPGTSLGTWDGASWKNATTSNPAWCLLDLLGNARYGLGLPSTALNYTRFDLYPIAQYADAQVPTGYTVGGTATTERRYTMNVSMNSQEDAYRVIQTMVSAFRGMTYWGAGRVVITADMPTVPSTVINQANVIDGDFVYEGTSLKTRHTVARVTWIDPSNSYMPSIEVVEDFDAVVTQGQIAVDIAGFGVTSRGLARRLGKWLLDTEKTQTELASFGTGLEQLRVRPGDVARIADPNYAGVRMGGRCKLGSTTTTIMLDATIIPSGTLSYFLTVTLPDGTVADRKSIFNIGVNSTINGTESIVTLNAALALAPDVNASWVISSTGTPGGDGILPVDTRQFRVLALAEPHRGQFQVSAVFHDPNKYARVEQDLKFDPNPYSTLGTLLASPLPPPSNVSARDYIAGVGTTTLVRATVSFSPATDARVTGAQIRAVGPESREQTVDGNTGDFDGLQLGTYVFGARSVGRDGRTSAWVDSASVVVDGIGDAPAAATGFTAQGSAMEVGLSWTRSASRDVLHYEIWRAPGPSNGTHPYPGFASWVPGATVGAAGATLLVTVDASSYIDRGDILGPDKAWCYFLRPVSTTLQPGAYVGPVKALTTYYLANNLEEAIRNTAPYAQTLLGQAPAIVNDLSVAGTTDGQLVFNRTNQQLYKWKSSTSSWVLYIPLVPDGNGQLTATQIASIDLARTQGTLTASQNTALIAAMAAGAISDVKIAGLSSSKLSDVDPSDLTTKTGVSAARILGSITNAQMPATIAASKLTDTNPADGTTVAGLAATKILGQLVAGQITAGAIDATKLSIISPTNFIGNSCWSINATGWTTTATAGTPTLVPITGSAAAATWSPAEADGGLKFTSSTTLAASNAGYMDLYTSPAGANGRAFTAGYPVVAGSTYEAQVKFISQLGTVQLNIIWVNAAGAQLTSTPNTAAFVTPPANGLTLANWQTAVLRQTAPAGAVWASLLIRVLNNTASAATPSIYLTQAMLGLSVPNAAQNAVWVPGGVTSVDGANIKTGTIAARAIVANTIGATELGIGNSSNSLYNSCFAITTEGWSMALGAGAAATIGSCASVQTAYQTGDGVGVAQVTTLPASTGYVDVYHSEVACLAGETWEAQALLLPIGCTAEIFLEYLSGPGNHVAYSAASNIIASQATPAAALQSTLSPFLLASLVTVVPASIVGTFTGSTSGTTLTVTGSPGVVFCIGMVITGGTLAAGTTITGFGTGSGGAGTYTISASQTVASTTMTGTAPTIAGIRMFIRAMNTTGSAVSANLFMTRTSLGKTFPGATSISPWSAGGSTQISGGVILTDGIVSRHILAGAIDASKLSISSPNNVISNGCCGVSAAGWSSGVAAWPTTSAYALPGFGAGYYSLASLGTVGVAGAAVSDFSWAPNGSLAPDGIHTMPWGAAVSVTPGETWEAQALVQTHRCAVELYIVFTKPDTVTAGNWVQAGGSYTTGTQCWTNPADSSSTAQFHQLSIRALVPAGATLGTLMMRMANNTASVAVFGSQSGNGPYVIFTKAGFGPVLTLNAPAPIPWAPGGTTAIDGGQVRAGTILAASIGAGQIVAGKLDVNAVVAGNIAAGAITASKLAVGNPSNVIWNSCIDQGFEGWGRGAIAGIAAPGSTNLPMDAASIIAPSWNLNGVGSAFGQWNGGGTLNPSQGFYWDWSPTSGLTGVPCNGSQTWGASAIVATGNSGSVTIAMIWLNGGGVEISRTVSSPLVNNGASGGQFESSYTRISVVGVSPAGAGYVLFRIQLVGGNVAGAAPFFAFSKAQLGVIPTGATVVGEWAPGGVTTLNGNVVKTGTLNANRIIANSITAGQIAARTLTANEIATGTLTANEIAGNTITGNKIAANTIVAGNIVAGAIGATEIAAGAVKTTHLASDFALISSAQIGTLTVQSANIANLTVGGGKLANNAVSNGGAGTATGAYTVTTISSWTSFVGSSATLDNSGGTIVISISCKNDADNGSYTPFDRSEGGA